MKIIIESIPYSQMRYASAGDYFTDPDGTRHILVASLNNEPMEAAIALHEMVEMFITEAVGISEPDILAFDLAYPGDDPGNDRRAPYHGQHVFSEALERLFCERMGIEWEDYGAAVDAL